MAIKLNPFKQENLEMEELNMLILQRHPGQSFWIGTDIQVVVLGHFNGLTHIGIKAPTEIKILRDELKDKEVSEKDD